MEHYRQAGEGLIELKALCRDTGRGFKELIGLNTGSGEVDFTYRRACHLMKLSNEWPVDWDRKALKLLWRQGGDSQIIWGM